MLAQGWPQGYPAGSTIPMAALMETAPAVLVPVMCRCRSCTSCTEVVVLTTANKMPVEEYEDCFKLRDHFQQASSGLSLCWCGACRASCAGLWPWAGQHRRDPAVLGGAVVFGAPAHQPLNGKLDISRNVADSYCDLAEETSRVVVTHP